MTIYENHLLTAVLRYARGARCACVRDYIERWSSWCKGLLVRCGVVSDKNKLVMDYSNASVTKSKLLEIYHENLFFIDSATKTCRN